MRRSNEHDVSISRTELAPRTAAASMVRLLVLVALLGVSCAGIDSAISEDVEATQAASTETPESAAQADPTTTEIAAEIAAEAPEPVPTLEAALGLAALEAAVLGLVDTVTVSDGAVLVAVFDGDYEPVVASIGTDDSGNLPTTNDPFRMASVTKTFTAVATLTLVEQGAVDLDAPASDYVSRVYVPTNVTVRNLLEHTSGIFNVSDDADLFMSLWDAPARRWTPEETFDLFGSDEPLFEPGSQFRYSNSNYLILGVLVEEVTGQQYHQVIRERILDPLNLSPSTYVAGFESGPEPFDPYVRYEQADYDFTSIATNSWSSGSIVSSALDLHVFFSALFNGQIISPELVAQMAEGDQYGLGLVLDDPARSGFYGHNGSILGYRSLVRHSPELGVTVFGVSTDSQSPGQAADALLTLLRDLPDLASSTE